MNEQEALNNIKEAMDNPFAFKKELDVLEKACLKAKKYDDKETPKKVIKRKETDIVIGDYIALDCPICKRELVLLIPSKNEIAGHKTPYCPYCANHLDWSE